MKFCVTLLVASVRLVALVIALDKDNYSLENKSRQRRSLMNLNSMVKAVTGREGTDFISYGNWCGLGGSGHPVDPIDECCQIHDFCFDLAKEGVCREYGDKAVYNVDYKWRKTDDGRAACEEEDDKCKSAICMCDAVITNCLKNNIDSYDKQNFKKLGIFELMEEADYLAS